MVAESSATAQSGDPDEKQDIFDTFVMGILNRDMDSEPAYSSDDEGAPPMQATKLPAGLRARGDAAASSADEAGLKQLQPEVPVAPSNDK